MKTRFIYVVMALICISVLTSCKNAGRHADLLIQQYSHSGRLCGHAFVYETDYGGKVTMSEETYPIYENEDGSYTIEYGGDNYALTELGSYIDAFNDGSTLLKYKIDSRHYVENIPSSY